MSLSDWEANGWIVPHPTSRQEIASLLGVVERNLADAAVKGLSSDSRLGLAYQAALQLARLGLAAEGYRPQRERAHERAIASLQFTIAADPVLITVLDGVRKKRNRIVYEGTGIASDTEVQEVFELATRLRQAVITWLEQRHPELYRPPHDPT